MKAINIANYIILYEADKKRCVSSIRLQKLLYFIQARFAMAGKKAFEEDIEAWMCGPIVNLVYQKYKLYGGLPIDSNFVCFEKRSISSKNKKIIESVLDYCSNIKTSELSRIIFKQEPWINAYKKCSIITLESMKHYYLWRKKI